MIDYDICMFRTRISSCGLLQRSRAFVVACEPLARVSVLDLCFATLPDLCWEWSFLSSFSHMYSDIGAIGCYQVEFAIWVAGLSLPRGTCPAALLVLLVLSPSFDVVLLMSAWSAEIWGGPIVCVDARWRVATKKQ